MIQVQNLSKKYGAVTAVDGLSFEVEPGKITGFLGPNGSGKSTTMRMILGLDRPTTGEVFLMGKRYIDITDPLYVVGALLDAEAMHPGRTGRNHLRIAARSNGIPFSRVDEVIALVNLGKAADRRIKGYSLGMRQRLGIASALIGDPKILIFDEPINGLDIDGVRWMRSLMRQLASEGRTVFVSSHLMSELQLIADRIVIISKGRLIADSSLDELLGSLSTQGVRVKTTALKKLEHVLTKQRIEYEHTGPAELNVKGLAAEKVAAIANSNKIPLQHLSQEEESLEEAYLRLTKSEAAQNNLTTFKESE